MGAKTGYHPISLNVIRGALEFSGFKASKIKRIAELPEQQKAIYTVWIEKSPNGSDTWPIKTWRRMLQHCFMDDIRVNTVRLSTDADPICVITVQLHRSPMDEVLEAGDKNGN